MSSSENCWDLALSWLSPELHLTFTWRSPDVHLTFTWGLTFAMRDDPELDNTLIWSPEPLKGTMKHIQLYLLWYYYFLQDGDWNLLSRARARRQHQAEVVCFSLWLGLYLMTRRLTLNTVPASQLSPNTRLWGDFQPAASHATNMVWVTHPVRTSVFPGASVNCFCQFYTRR